MFPRALFQQVSSVTYNAKGEVFSYTSVILYSNYLAAVLHEQELIKKSHNRFPKLEFFT
jgi:hypothetical protein